MRLTEKKVLYMMLNDAIEWQESLLDAYRTPSYLVELQGKFIDVEQATEIQKVLDAYIALRNKYFGEPVKKVWKSISLYDILKSIEDSSKETDDVV